MATWVLVLILSGASAGIATIPGYASIEECRIAGSMMKIADAEIRMREGQKSIVMIESRCISGPSK
jgi:hypothetical protein